MPFKTVLASYFVWVDFMLFSQYFYYGYFFPKKHAEPPQPEPSPVERYRTRRRSYSTEIDRHHHHYRELSTAAANLAVAAAIAASEEEPLQHVKSPARVLGGTRANRPPHRRSSTSITRSEAEEAEDEVDEDALAALADSFHSEGGRKRLSWSQERYTSGRGGSTSRTRLGTRSSISPFTTIRALPHIDTAHEPHVVDATGSRGRARQRQIVDSPIDAINLENQDIHRGPSISLSPTRDRRNSRASQRSVGLVFLGVWALFSIGSITTTSMPHSSTFVYRGTVLSNVPSLPQSFPDMPPARLEGANDSLSSLSESEPSSERVVGRIFAWLCTTLYLTSRLPQIWKNVRDVSSDSLACC